MSRPFHPSELSDADGSGPTTAELSEALAVARDLEANLAVGDVHPSSAFADRVMGAIALEPLPQPAIAAGSALRGGRLGAMTAALADSWRVAFSGGRPFAVRAQAAAFVLVVVVAAGSLGGVAAIGAVRFIQAAPSQVASPPPLVPSTQPLRNPSLEPSDGLAPAIQPADSEGPKETEQPGQSEEPGETQEPTAKPGGTHDASKTPRPARTPKPTETDDHGAGSGGDPEPTEDPTETPSPDAGTDGHSADG